MSQKKFETLVIEENEQICTVSVNRPQALNALNAQVLAEFGAFITELDARTQSPAADSPRVLIITGSGDKSFVAGADIKELSQMSASEARAFAEHGQKLFRRLEILKIPVIGAINGFALGGGCELALACDFLVCSQNAKFGLPEVSLGLIPGFGGTQRLARYVGLGRAKELVMSGRQVAAEEAFRIGLVNAVVEAGQTVAKAQEIARMIISRGPLAVAAAKQAVEQGYDAPLDEGLSIERDAFSELFRSADTKEGTTAFLEKRPAKFTGR